ISFIKRSESIHSISQGARCLSLTARARFPGSRLARINGKRRHFERSSPLSNPAEYIEADPEGVDSLKRILGRCHRLLSGNDQFKSMAESRLLKSNRQSGIILSLSPEAMQSRNILANNGCGT